MNILYLKSSNFNFVCILFLSKTLFISTMNVMLLNKILRLKIIVMTLLFFIILRILILMFYKVQKIINLWCNQLLYIISFIFTNISPAYQWRYYHANRRGCFKSQPLSSDKQLNQSSYLLKFYLYLHTNDKSKILLRLLDRGIKNF